MALEIVRVDHSNVYFQYWVRVSEDRCLIMEFTEETAEEDVLQAAQDQLDAEIIEEPQP